MPSAPAKPRFKALRGVEIFAPGNWGGGDWTEDHVRSMVENFRLNEGKVRVPLDPDEREFAWSDVAPELGHEHPTLQKLLEVLDLEGAGNTGRPALGKVTALWEHGGRLFGDIEQIPAALADLIDSGALGSVSAVIYEDPAAYGCQGAGAMLKAVGLLGAQQPEVKGMRELPRPSEFAERLRGQVWVFAEARAVPLTKKGDEILRHMKDEYGDRGEEIFYRSANKGTIKGVHEHAERPDFEFPREESPAERSAKQEYAEEGEAPPEEETQEGEAPPEADGDQGALIALLREAGYSDEFLGALSPELQQQLLEECCRVGTVQAHPPGGPAQAAPAAGPDGTQAPPEPGTEPGTEPGAEEGPEGEPEPASAIGAISRDELIDKLVEMGHDRMALVNLTDDELREKLGRQTGQPARFFSEAETVMPKSHLSNFRKRAAMHRKFAEQCGPGQEKMRERHKRFAEHYAELAEFAEEDSDEARQFAESSEEDYPGEYTPEFHRPPPSVGPSAEPQDPGLPAMPGKQKESPMSERRREFSEQRVRQLVDDAIARAEQKHEQRVRKIEHQFAEQRRADQAERVDGFLAEMRQAGKVSRAELDPGPDGRRYTLRDRLLAAAASPTVREFSEGGKARRQSLLEAEFDLIRARPVAFAERVPAGGGAQAQGGHDPERVRRMLEATPEGQLALKKQAALAAAKN